MIAQQRSLRRFVAGLVMCSMVIGATAFGSAGVANATNYPSYADVVNARSSEAAKQAEIAVINQLIVDLANRAAATASAAAQAGNAADIAQSKYDGAVIQAANLETKATEGRTAAERSRREAGKLAAMLAESGASDLSASIFFSGTRADSLLSGLGLASIVHDQSAGVYAKAVQDERQAGVLTNQANRAKDALRALADASQVALQAAAIAAQAAAAALSDQQSHQLELDAQLTALTAATATAETDYAAAIAAAVAAAAAAAASARQAAPAVAAGAVTSAGWTRPSAGHISSPYGYRIDPYNGVYQLHEGTDLAPGCNSPIYAAHSGTVVLAGPYGGYGNYIRIRNSGDSSYETAYGHIVNGGILVQIGEQVSVGQNIARIGSTGMSTGCHLHFEIHHNGATQDPVPFLRAQGVELAN